MPSVLFQDHQKFTHILFHEFFKITVTHESAITKGSGYGTEYNVLTFFEAFSWVAPVKHEWQLPDKNQVNKKLSATYISSFFL